MKDIILIIRKNYPMFVTPYKYSELNSDYFSKKFKAAMDLKADPDLLVYVKCDSEGKLDMRKRSGDTLEYRIFDVSKHEKVEHLITLKENQNLRI